MASGVRLWLVILALPLVVVSACGAPSDRAIPAAETELTPTPTGRSAETTSPAATLAGPSPSPSPSPPAPARTQPWRAGPHEVLPQAKELAARVAEAVTTYEVGDAADVVVGVTTDPSRRDATRLVAEPLLDADRWSRGRVRYAQLGGLHDDRASVMVVVERRSAAPGAAVETDTRTLDVRLLRVDGHWRFDALASVGGEPVPRPDDLDPASAAVLDDDRIELSDSTRWDVHAGVVEPTLLEVMADIAEQTPYTVVTITNGHPRRVFGTTRESDHTRGLAVDIALIAGTPVVASREHGSPAHVLTRWLWEHPDVRQIGSPWALDGYGGRSFTDLVHQDHLHVAVRPGRSAEDVG